MQNLQNFFPHQDQSKTHINLSSKELGEDKIVVKCKKCNDAKFVRLNLPVDDPDFGKPISCECIYDELPEHKREKLLIFSRIDSLIMVTFDFIEKNYNHFNNNFSKPLKKAMDFAQEKKGWLIIQGHSGSGKTSLSAAILNVYLDSQIASLFYSSNDLFEEFYSSMNAGNQKYSNLVDKLKNIEMLVIDDLNLTHVSPWAMEKFIQILIYRYEKKLSTVINYINLPDDIDDRLLTRLNDNKNCQKIFIDKAVDNFFAVGGMIKNVLKNYSFDNFESKGHGLIGEIKANLEDALNLSKNWTEKPEGWLVLIGMPGCGKTHLAASICNQRMQLGDEVCFASVPDLLDELRSSYANKDDRNFDQLFKKIMNVEILALDDLGAHQISPWVDEKLYQLFNYRYIKKLPTIITRNTQSSSLDVRIKSRLADLKLATNFEILAPDYRIGSI
jgi:DNA replication protein DnaC